MSIASHAGAKRCAAGARAVSPGPAACSGLTDRSAAKLLKNYQRSAAMRSSGSSGRHDRSLARRKRRKTTCLLGMPSVLQAASARAFLCIYTTCQNPDNNPELRITPPKKKHHEKHASAATAAPYPRNSARPAGGPGPTARASATASLRARRSHRRRAAASGPWPRRRSRPFC